MSDISELRQTVKEVCWPTSPFTVDELLVLLDRLEAAEKERDELRAKIEQMEKQEPVGTLHDDGCFVWRETAPHQSNYAGWKMALYALPGAQNAPSVQDGWREAAIAWGVCASIHREYARGKDPFFGTRQKDFEKHANDARAMLAAAQEAK